MTDPEMEANMRSAAVRFNEALANQTRILNDHLGCLIHYAEMIARQRPDDGEAES